MNWYKVAPYLLLPCFLLFGNTLLAQINVSPNQTALALAQKLAGQGVTITNATLNCYAQANGFFTATGSTPGLDSGIVLTTGVALTQGGQIGVNGPASDLADVDNGFPQDSSLTILAGESTTNACDLEFDLEPHGDSIKFDYVFGSEEYESAVCGTYNDAFAFFISGAGITGAENMALVPGTNIPVAINSINDGVPGVHGDIHNCNMMGPGAPFTSYYIDNSSGTTLTYKGLTTVLEAKHAVTPCHTYHLKLVIADAGDPLYDSGVFLKAGSLQTGNYTVEALPPFSYDTTSFCIKGCLPGKFRIHNTDVSPMPRTIKYVTAGTAISGGDYTPVTDSVVVPAYGTYADVVINGLPTALNGPKTLNLFVLPQFSCSGTYNFVDSAAMLIYDTVQINILTHDTSICSNDTVQLRVTGDSILIYNWSPAAGLSNPYTQDPLASPQANTTYVVTASLPGTSCPSKTDSVHFNIKLTPAFQPVTDTAICYNTAIQLAAPTMQGNTYYSYSWSGPAGYASTLSAPLLAHVTALNSGTYTLTVTNDTDRCIASAFLGLTVVVPDTPTVTSPQIFCLDKPADSLIASGNDLLWYTAQSDTPNTLAPAPSTGDIANYDYFVTQTINGCESPKTPVIAQVLRCCDGNIFIPTAFTPNNDGLNDKFDVRADYGYTIKTMYIYNRFGQVVYSGTSGVWDGTLLGTQAEVGTYYYKVLFGCILGGTTQRVGDVTLIR